MCICHCRYLSLSLNDLVALTESSPEFINVKKCERQSRFCENREMVESDTFENKQNDTQAEDDVRRKEKMEREEYMEKLKKWLDDARLWHYNICAGLPVHSGDNSTIPDDTIHQVPNVYANLTHLNLWNQNAQNLFQQRFLFNGPDNRNLQNVFQTGTHIFQQNPTPSTYEFVIPPLWKRAIAELMDFLLLFLFKMALTFVLLESFDIIGMGFYGFELFQKNLENPQVAMPMAMELLTLELLHRIVVCAYETYFLQGRFFATPGKRYMGLMVITAESITPVPGRLTETIVATGATPLGWHKSLTRSALKNLFVGLFLPMCVAFYIFPHNRTGYDMMSNSVVVEYHQEFMLYNAI
ncbi:unnamed protein product [Phaedon cochleariae]|uniref:RDD domain-containing protein n=1 Tax=Phaedon cochleariae TaxID=80249 RepID=A0A9P0DL25_PHACE|nr:unnamed protein product [Phaedon cochleariae]